MPGPRNLITDVPGLKVGNAEDPALKSGATVLLPDESAVVSVAIHGGAPGTREIALLEPERHVSYVGRIVVAYRKQKRRMSELFELFAEFGGVDRNTHNSKPRLRCAQIEARVA